MKILIFFSRIALICNICFAISLLIRSWSGINESGVGFIGLGTVVVLATVAVVLNFLLTLMAIVLFFSKKLVVESRHRWLLIANFLFFILQIFIPR